MGFVSAYQRGFNLLYRKNYDRLKFRIQKKSLEGNSLVFVVVVVVVVVITWSPEYPQ